MSELPESWTVSTFGEINTFESKTVDPTSQPDETFELYSVPSYPSKRPELLAGSHIGSTKQTVEPNDVLVCKINPRINRVWVVGPKREHDQIASSEWIGFRSDLVRPAFAKHYFSSPTFRDLLCSEVTGVGGSLTRAQPKRVAGYPVPLAPLNEQTRIADQLDALLARIQACNDRLDAIPALLKRFRQSVLTAAMSGDLTSEWRDTEALKDSLPVFLEGNLVDTTQIDSAFSVPGSWRIVQARNLVRPDAGIVYGIVQPGPKLLNGIRYVQITDIVDGRIQIQSLSYTSEEIADGYRRSSIQKGDVLLGIIRALKVAVVPDELEGANISRSVARLRPREGVLPKFLAYALQCPVVQEWLRSQHRGMDMPVLNLSEIRLAPIPIAPMDEQSEIVRRVDVLFAIADRIEARYASAIAHIQRLTPLTLAKAFRGELAQQDPNDELASVLLQRIAKTPTAAAKAPRGRPRSKQANPATPLPTVHPDEAALPAGAWAASAQPDEHATAALLIAVLKAWGQPMPQDQARLAAVLCLQPRLFTAALPAHDATPWRRLVGAEAEPLPASVAALQPALNAHWRRALTGLRARGDLVASGSGPQDTWTLGPGADRVDTAGWPDGRAGWVVAYLRAHGVEAVLPLLPTAAADFVHARAA
jgi:type I restriction enzyme, S subunit